MSHLVKKCACGAVYSAPCATVGDIPAVSAAATGWGYDDRGRVKCPTCLKPAEDLTPEGIQLVIPGAERVQAPSAKQMELF